MPENTNGIPNQSVVPTPNLSLKSPYYLENFIKTVSEIVKFFSSPHRASTYSQVLTEKESKEKLAENRTHLKLTDLDYWNYNSPKISRKEFEAIITDWDIYQEYSIYVLLKKPEEIKRPNLNDLDYLNVLFVEFVNRLEKDWLFYRSYFKLFHDVSKEKTVLYIDLAAYCSTRHFRFLMRKAFGYLEGNYVTSLRREGKVYIPHLQFANESVELLYTSAENLELEYVIADYFIKENIVSVDDFLARLEKIINLQADVAKEEMEPIFLNPSPYIDRVIYINMFRDWINNLRTLDINFQDRKAIIKNINFNNLQIDESMFLKENLIGEDVYNFESDKNIFLEDSRRAKRRLIQVLFNHLLQYSINRFRFESSKEAVEIEERTEYEYIFREYKNMTFLEQDVNCLLVECGEISFVTMLWRYIENPEVLNSTEKLLYWGLIEAVNEKFKFSSRAKRMARWCMKLIGLKYTKGKIEINYFNKNKISKSYKNLTDEGNLFAWMMKVNDKERLSRLLGEICCPPTIKINEKEITRHFLEIVRHFYDYQDPAIQEKIRNSVKHSRFQKNINEFLRANEIIDRAVIAFPISTIPTEVEKKIRAFSIFIGTFTLDDRLDNENEELFEKGRREITDMLNYAKIFYTLVGKPAAESASEAIIQEHVRQHIEFSLGRYAHKIKNEGVNLVSRMEMMWNLVNKNKKFEPLQKEALALKDGVERLSGTIHILNIASNGLKLWYMESNPYCILDVILGAYCNAFQQFFISGIEEEREKFWSKKEKKYEAPLLKIDLEFRDDEYQIKKTINIAYHPVLPGTDFMTNMKDYHIFDHTIDADDMIGDESLKFLDNLPQKVILKSPFLEIFYNALTHMEKERGKPNVIDLKINRNRKEIIFQLLNPIKKKLQYSQLTEDISNSPGLRANILFFKNIGGNMNFAFKDKAVSEVKINLQNIMRILKKENSHGIK